jgi:hypothetical protein
MNTGCHRSHIEFNKIDFIKVVADKMRSKLAWNGHVTRRDESDITKRVMNMNVDEHPGRGRP